MRSHIGRRRLLAGRFQRILEDGVDDLPSLERAMRRALGDEHRAAGGRSSLLTKIAAQCIADLYRDRQAVVQLALAEYRKFTRTPVDVTELDRDDLGRAQSEPGHQQQHRIVPRTAPGIVAHGSEHRLDAVRRQVARQSRASGLGRLRQTQRQVGCRGPASEQILKEDTDMGRHRLVAAAAGQHMLHEAGRVGGTQAARIDDRLAKAIIEEATREAYRVRDGTRAEASLLHEVGLEVRKQRRSCDLRLRQRRRLRPADLDQMLNKPTRDGVEAYRVLPRPRYVSRQWINAIERYR